MPCARTLPPGTAPAEHAFLYAGGRMYDLNRLVPAVSGWFLMQANGINDKRQIVGGGNVGGRRNAFPLTPG